MLLLLLLPACLPRVIILIIRTTMDWLRLAYVFEIPAAILMARSRYEAGTPVHGTFRASSAGVMLLELDNSYHTTLPAAAHACHSSAAVTCVFSADRQRDGS
jgi:hypothetical protein